MRIPEDEIWFSFSRSGGPGGQNVNKVSSKVTLHWAIAESSSLSNFQKAAIKAFPRLNSLIDSSGILNLNCQVSRSQAFNRKLALEKLQELVTLAFIPKKPRRKTKPSKGQKEKRIKAKKSRSQRLVNRRIQSE